MLAEQSRPPTARQLNKSTVENNRFYHFSKVVHDPPSTPQDESSAKIYADLDAVQNAMVSSSLATEFHSSAEAAAAAAAGLVVPMTEDVAAASAAAAATFMQWEYLDANTIRTYEIPVHIGGDTTGCYESFTLPQGFTPIQQFPYVSQASVAPPPPPPPSTAPSAAGENHSILIQRVPHRSRKGRGINFPTMTL